VREYTGVFGGGKREDKIVRTIHEWFWKFSVKYELIAYVGNTPDENVVLQKRGADCELMTSSASTPHASSIVHDGIDCNITWLLQQITLSPTPKLSFKIDRSVKSCHTPRRNADVSAALSMQNQISTWSARIHRYFGDLMSKQQNNAFDMSSINIKTIFNPVLPLFEERAEMPAIEVREKLEKHLQKQT
jgi:hypothetical protein